MLAAKKESGEKIRIVPDVSPFLFRVGNPLKSRNRAPSRNKEQTAGANSSDRACHVKGTLLLLRLLSLAY